MKKAPSRERRKSIAIGAKKESLPKPIVPIPVPDPAPPAVAASAAPAVRKASAAPAGAEGTAAAGEPKLLVEVERRIRASLELFEKRLAAPEPAPPDPRSLSGGDLEEVAASFRRAVSEVIDRKLEEFLPAVATLYHRLYEESRSLEGDSGPLDRDDLQMVLTDAVQDLGKILKALGGSTIAPEVGEPYDPLIHLAVGEAPTPAEGDGVVAGVVRPGTKSGRGRVLVPARVLVGRQG